MTTRREYLAQETNKLFYALETMNATEFIDMIESYIHGDTSISREFVLAARDKREGHWGDTLLHRAVTSNAIWQARYLVEIGALLDAIDTSTKKATPLMHAIHINNETMAVFLVSSGASLACIDINHENALHYIARFGSLNMLRVCIQESQLSAEMIRELASSPNIKMKFPEDVAGNSMIKDALIMLREHGFFVHKKTTKGRPQGKRKRKGKKTTNEHSGVLTMPSSVGMSL